MAKEKKELTEEELKLLRQKRAMMSRRRDEQIRKMMAENKKIIGEKKFEKTKKEAKKMAAFLQAEAMLEMTDEEVKAKLAQDPLRHNKNYRAREKAKEEQILNDKNSSPEFIKKYLLAKKTTRSTTVAKELAETLSEEELVLRHAEYRKKMNEEKAKQRAKKKEAAEKTK